MYCVRNIIYVLIVLMGAFHVRCIFIDLLRNDTVCNFHEPKFATSAQITALFLDSALANFSNHSGSAKPWHVTLFRSHITDKES